MEVSVLDKQTIQCIMTEDEIADYGMDKKALFQNDDRVQEFFRKVMQQAEQKIGFRKEEGNVAVHASFLSDESLAITFSVVQGNTTVILKSKNLWNMIRFCEQSSLMPQASLYRYKQGYFLLADIQLYGPREIAVLFTLADEYLDAVCYTSAIAAFIKEHGRCIIASHAMEVLGTVSVQTS